MKYQILNYIVFSLVIFYSIPLSAQNLNALKITPGDIPSATLPLDVALKHRFTVQNTGTTSLTFDLRTKVVETNQEAPTFPQPPTIYLSPSEETVITIILDAAIGNLSQLPVGKHIRTVVYKFINSINSSDSLTVSIEYPVTILNKTNISGSFQITGKAVDQNGSPLANVNINLETGTDITLATGTGSNGAFSFSVPKHSKWMLKGSKQGYSDAYAFVDSSSQQSYELKLVHFENTKAQFQSIKTVNTNIGFWQGAVTDDEQHILLTQGMEIWNNPDLRQHGKLMLYNPNGTMVWEYEMGYEAWGASISSDGKYAAYAQKHFLYPELVLLDATQPSLIWKKDLNIENFPTGSSFIGHSSNEVRISNTNKYIGVGTGEGDFYLLNLSDGKLLWRKFLKGQVRNSRFTGNDEFVYVGSDPWLYKFRISDSSEVWKSNIYSWPLHYGLRLSPDESMIASMVKSGEVTVIRTSDGKRLWSYDQGVIGQWVDFSRDGKYLAAAAFGGVWIYDAPTGKTLWRAKGTKAGYFSFDNKYLLLNNELYTVNGTRILMLQEMIGSQFAFINKGNTRIVLATGQMNGPGTGIAVYEGSIVTSVVGVENQIPLEFDLKQNYPNPFNPSTVISYHIPAVSHVSLKVYDILAREVATLVDEEKSPGIYRVRFDGSGLASSVYFYRLKAGSYVDEKKMMVLK